MTVYQAKDFSHLIGVPGLSQGLLENHFKLYEGYVKNVNQLVELFKTLATDSPEYAELKRRFGWEWNGVRLHELYFGNMTANPLSADEFSLYKKIVEDFGSYENWEKDFRGTGAIRGIGWVILYFDPRANQLFNVWINEHDFGHLAGCIPLLVFDVFEHAYMLDYGVNRSDYITTFMKLIHWNEISRRFDEQQA